VIDGDGMKIGDIRNLLGVSNTEKGRINKGQGGKVQRKVENVDISGKVEILNLLRRAKDIPEIREELVARLRESIENGTYKVDPEKIAKKISKEEF